MTNRVEEERTLAPFIAPYIRVSYTAFHRNMVSGFTQVKEKRIDQTWSILFLIGRSQDGWGE